MNRRSRSESEERPQGGSANPRWRTFAAAGRRIAYVGGVVRQAYPREPSEHAETTNPCQPGNTYAILDKDEAKLSAAETMLQVAQDRLTRLTGTIPAYHARTTRRVDCGALPVGPGAGPPPAACPGLP
jgi:hypothetical protein